ncbi:MAG: aspartate kinase, partial [Clostridiales bacterium]|nr:aspartate kinase [Clostridiales bacterium]
RENKETCDALLERVRARFYDIVQGLSLDFALDAEFDTIRGALYGGASEAYAASRGEYLSARITAKLLGAMFIDAADLIRFDDAGNYDREATQKCVRARLPLLSGRVVIPGFYGATSAGEIKTFTRGGSDITGAIVARGASCELYENWTDVDGFMAVDPHLRGDARVIDMLSYRELRELSAMGAAILHPDSIFPLCKSDIPICIRNTFNPSAAGTMIVPTAWFSSGAYTRNACTLAGIAGKRDVSVIRMEKVAWGVKRGVLRQLLCILGKYGVLPEHLSSSVDAVAAVVDASALQKERIDEALAEIEERLRPRSIALERNLSLIALVGHGISRDGDIIARTTAALSKANIPIRLIDFGASELRLTVGVESRDYEQAVGVLYDVLI